MNACATPAVSARVSRLALEPDGAAWAGRLRAHLDRRGELTPEARRFREQLDLPSDRPIVMGGHQAGFWHPGILAKLLAANALAARSDAAVAWLVVDQDTNDPFEVAYPVTDERWRVRAAAWRAAPSAPFTTTGSREARAPAPAPTVPDDEGLTARLASLADALRAQSSAPSAAAQVTRANLDLLSPVTPAPAVVMASSIARTDLFARVIERARQDPGAAHGAYNDAAARFPDADVRPLGSDGRAGVELPFWIATADGRRRPMHEADLAGADGAVLPRGLLMTALVRLAGCDLFVHGTGGGAYEPINDAWLSAWMGEGALAPFVTATADVRMVLTGDEVPRAEAARARWRARHARHHPGEVGDGEAQRARDALVARIGDLPRGSPERDTVFGELRALLEDARREHADDLAALDRRADELAARTDPGLVAQDRAWPAVLYEPGVLLALREGVEARFG